MSDAIEALIAKQEIYELSCRYMRGLDRLDAQLMRDQFWEDGWCEYGFYDSSPSEFIDFCMEALKEHVANQHMIGNVLVELDGDGNSQIVHYGGDSGDESRYRGGTLWFVHNTVWSERTGNTTLVRLSGDTHRAVIENSIIASAGPLAVLASTGEGVVDHTWLSEGWRTSHDGGFTGSLTVGTVPDGADPGWTDAGARAFGLTASSPALDAGGPVEAPATPTWQWGADGLETRPDDGSPDLGALER